MSYFCHFCASFPNKTTLRYIIAATIARIITLVITRSSWNTCPPYTIKYPRPALETKNSPDITPTSDNPILTLSEFIKVEMFAGITIFVNTCNLVALNVFAIFSNSLSVFINPFRISRTVTISEIANAINIIAPIPAPTHIIITGPSAILGKLFKTTKNGSATLDKKLDHHKIIATITPRIAPDTNPIIVSKQVTPKCSNKLFP